MTLCTNRNNYIPFVCMWHYAYAPASYYYKSVLRPQCQSLSFLTSVCVNCQTSDLSKANATEEEKVLAMISQSGETYNPMHYVKYSGPRRGGGVAMPIRPPPPTYRCYRCGQQGHYINQCPTNGVWKITIKKLPHSGKCLYAHVLECLQLLQMWLP